MQKTVIITSGRSGSSLLVQGLNKAGYNTAEECLCNNMIFMKRFHEFVKEYGDYTYEGPMPSELRTRLTNADYLGKIFHKYDLAKLLYSHICRFDECLQYLADRKDIKVIHLIRYNPLAQTLSHKVAHANNLWHVARHKERPDFKPVEVSFEDVVSSQKYLTRCRDKVNKYFPNNLHITYNDLLVDWDKTMDKVQLFTGCNPPVKIEKIYKRSLIKPMRELITNYDSLYAECEGTEYERFFV